MKKIIPVALLVLTLLFIGSCKKESKTEPIPCDFSIIKWEEDIVLENDFYVDNARLVISPGVTVSFNIGCRIIVGDEMFGEIIARGNEGSPITFVSLNPQANDATRWGSIHIKKSCDDSGSMFEHCNFINGGRDGYEAVIVCQSGNLFIDHCTIDGSTNHGVLLKYNASFGSFSNNTIKRTQGHPISISANQIGSIGDDNRILSDSIRHGILIYDDRLYLRDTIIIKPQTLPYVISKELNITGDGEVTSLMIIKAGVVFSLERDVRMIFRGNGRIEALGTEEKPIIFTSNAVTPKPGDWHCINFALNNSILKHCIFEYGGKYEDFMVSNGMVRPGNVDLSIINCTFQYSEAAGLLLYKTNSEKYFQLQVFKNNVFQYMESYSVSLFPQSIQSLNSDNNFNNYKIQVYKSDILEDHVLWKNVGTDFFTESNFSVYGENCATLEFEPGVNIYFDKGGFFVGRTGGWEGKIVANGTEDNPIVFTSAKESPTYGDWSGIMLANNTGEGCVLDNCHILYAGNQTYNFESASIRIYNNDANVTIKNSTIAHSNNWGIYFSHSQPFLVNNNYFDNLGGDVNGK